MFGNLAFDTAPSNLNGKISLMSTSKDQNSLGALRFANVLSIHYDNLYFNFGHYAHINDETPN